jgi:serine/threonine-protein kinase
MQVRVHRRNRRRTRIGAVLALLLAVAAIATYAVIPKPASVPDLRGRSVSDARVTLKREGLKLGNTSEVYSDVVAKGSIVRTEPPMHTKVKDGTVIDISVSRGAQLFLVPPVVKKQLDEAKAMMSGVGFSLQVASEEYNDTVPKGAVASITPDEARAKRGTSFAAVVSKGPPPVTVPDTSGLSASNARTAIEGAGLVFAEDDQYSDTVDQGTSMSSTPAGGSSAPKGSTVTVVVSKGPRPFPMPNFVGMSVSGAKAKAKSSGLVVRNTYAVPGSGKPSGQVQGQNPPAGTNVRKGTGIDLYYST